MFDIPDQRLKLEDFLLIVRNSATINAEATFISVILTLIFG